MGQGSVIRRQGSVGNLDGREFEQEVRRRWGGGQIGIILAGGVDGAHDGA